MKPRLIIAGGGPTALALAARAVGHWRPMVIDPAEDLKERFSHLPEVELLIGDATSTLVLKKATAESADHAVATTGDDEVNLEFCTLLRERHGLKTLISLVHDEEAVRRFRDRGVITVSRAASVASIVESLLDPGRRTTTDIGLGIGEIYEVTVQPHSPVIGKTLALLRPQSWILGAIYRDGALVVPHGHTTIESDDKCLLIGDPTILGGIADYFQRGGSEFPLQFGTRYCLVETPEGLPVDEARWLVENTEATGLAMFVDLRNQKSMVAHGDDIEVLAKDEDWPEGLVHQLDLLDSAGLVVAAPAPDWRDAFGFGNAWLAELLNQTYDPLLVARGTFPYKKILLSVAPGSGAQRTAELAVDVARKLDASLHAVGVCPAEIVSGEEYRPLMQRALDQARSISNLYSRELPCELLDGNPIHKIIEKAEGYDLLILGHRQHRRFSLIKPDVSRQIATRAPCSTLILPYQKDDPRLGR